MLYVIHAFDEQYGGFCGIEDWSICDCENEVEANSIAWDISMDIINSFSCIYEELEATVEDNIFDDMSKDDIEQLRSDIYEEDVAYDIWKVDKDIAKEYDIDILENMLNNDPEGFIEKYCNE